MLKRWLRAMLGMPQPKISREQALSVARKFGEKKGWELKNPVVQEGLKIWTVRVWGDILNPPVLVIDNQNGSILNVRRLSR